MKKNHNNLVSVLTRTFQKVGVFFLCVSLFTMSSYQKFENNNDAEEEGGGVDDEPSLNFGQKMEEIPDNNLDQQNNIDFQKQTPKNNSNVVDINFKENNHNNTKKRIDYDHIEVSLEEPEESREIITRASDFFLEYNDNFRMSWKETVELDQRELDDDLDVDPSRPPQQGWNKEYLRSVLRFYFVYDVKK